MLQLYNAGEVNRLDYERAKNLVNTTSALLPQYKRISNTARLQLAILTNQSPKKITELLLLSTTLPKINIVPILDQPAQIIERRPDIKTAKYFWQSKQYGRRSTEKLYWPSLSVGSFFGIADNSLVSSTDIWSLSLNSTLNLLNFGRIEAEIDQSKSEERQAFLEYKKSVITTVAEIEQALANYNQFSNQLVYNKKAYHHAKKSYQLSKNLYKQGEVSFLDLLEAQRTLNTSNLALISAKSDHTISSISLFKAFAYGINNTKL